MSDAKRIPRVTDQSITAYSILRDRARRRSFLLVGTMLVINIGVLMVVLAPDDLLSSSDNGRSARIAIAIASGVAFFMALVHLLLRLDTKAAEYAGAADRCADFKLALRSGSLESTMDEDYKVLQAGLPRIRDRQFARLKIRHTRKVEISKLIDQQPGVPYWLAWLRVVRRAMKNQE